MEKRGVITVISGFSGAGKGTIVKELVSRYDYWLSVSATSRQPREGEVQGKEYFFLTREEFQCMIKDGQLVEWTEYVGNYYGTPKKYIEEQLIAGRDVILEIETEGALNVKNVFDDVLLLFITPPTAEELKNRLVSRGTETEEVIKKRLARAYEEVDFMPSYDYIVVNDKLEECVEKVHELIQNRKMKVYYQQDNIRNMKTELKAFQEGE